MPIRANILRVFVDEDERYGNPLAVVFDEDGCLRAATRQAVARALGDSETVLVTSSRQRRIVIHTPIRGVAFAGHAAVGAAWLLGAAKGFERTPLCSGSAR